MSAHATEIFAVDAGPEQREGPDSSTCTPAVELPTLSITWRVPGPALAHIAQALTVPANATSAVLECRVSPSAGIVLCVRFLSSRGTGVGGTPVHEDRATELIRLRPASLRCERDEYGYTHLDCDGIVSISITDDAHVSYIRSELPARLGLPGGTYAAPTMQ